MLEKSKIYKFYRHIRFFVNLFLNKELTMHASSLSYYTIFSIIPLILILLTLVTILPSFSEYYESIKTFIFSSIMPVNSEAMMGYIDSFLANSVKIGTIGFIMIVIASFFFFETFEYIANKIFHAKKRKFWKSLIIYFTFIVLTPVAFGLFFYISALLSNVIDSNFITSWINILPLLPYVIIWGMFFIIFQISANTKIYPKASMISALVVSVIFNVSKNVFIYYVFFNKSYTTMYGSFAVLMFLFLWIYVSWIIFVYGLKLCYLINRVYKNREAKKK